MRVSIWMALALVWGVSTAWADSAQTGHPPEQYNVAWDSPSKDSLDSMPLSGRRGAGANVWVQDGALWLYLAHSGAYDEQGRLLKLGCVRITPAGVKLGEAGFRQELDLIEASSGEPQALDVAFGTWRDQQRNGIRSDMHNGRGNYSPDHSGADTSGFVWFHRNAASASDVQGKAKRQGIPADAVADVTTRRVSGGALAVAGGLSQPTAAAVQWQFWEGKAWTGRTPASTSHRIALRLGAKLDADPQQWRAEAQAMLSPAVCKAAKADELKRWGEFWARSHIVVNAGAKPDDAGWLIGRNYQLFRYMLACNRDGELPLLFNGGIFTTDNKPGRITGNNNDELPIAEGGPITPDFRRWMGCHFMSQNQRWLGWPALAGGDADLLAPSLAFYRDRSITAAARARKNGAEGVVYPEPLDVWGLCCVAPRPDGLCGAQHLTYHFSMMLEHAWMALQARDALGISLKDDLPWIEGTVKFYGTFYKTGTDGKLVIHPSNGLEYAGDATNPIEAVAGLTRITAGLLALPELSAASRAWLREFQAKLPALPTGRRRGRLALLPAQAFTREYNKWEPIEMYAYWPYRLAGITQPATLQLARDTWETVPADRARLCKQDYSWMANVVNMAALAWPEQAKERAIYKMANNTAPQARFPAFLGHDWLPDHNWGGAGMTGIQEMLLAPEPGPHGKLHLFPAWPADWDVDFKLHAPGQTLVEGVLRGGKLESLKVTPSSRAADVVNWIRKIPPYEPLPPPPVPLSQGKTVTVSSQFAEPGYDPARAVDGDLKTRWASDFAARSGWIAIDLGEEKEIGRVWLSEIEWRETREFAIEIQQGETWKEIARGTTIGADKDITFAPVKARHIRLNVFKAARPININEFQVFAPDRSTTP
ncbi:MAG: DUF5703 domain-containing protein [Kiritimatiellaeota bacterium]|nr:DUF5703 domain-containing protein [Kiritimatiellota bacterium]